MFRVAFPSFRVENLQHLSCALLRAQLSIQTESLWAVKSQTWFAFSFWVEKWVDSPFYTELLPSAMSRATLFCFFLEERLETGVQPWAVDCKFTPASLSKRSGRVSILHQCYWVRESFSLWQVLLSRQTGKMTLLTFCNHIPSLPVQHLPSTLSVTLREWIWSKIVFSARQGSNDCADGSTPSGPHREALNAVWPRMTQFEKCRGSCTHINPLPGCCFAQVRVFLCLHYSEAGSDGAQL